MQPHDGEKRHQLLVRRGDFSISSKSVVDTHVPKGLAARPLILESGQIHVWLTCLCEICRGSEADCLEVLSLAERARWRRFIAEDARLQYLVSRALVRTTLSRYDGIPARAWEFETNGYGRPYISGLQARRGLQFNLSNTTGLVACAVTRDCCIGIDVENIKRVLDIEALAPNVFAPKEIEDFVSCPATARRDRFFSYWTLKESYIKGRGMGLSIPLDSFWFDLSGLAPVLYVTERCGDEQGPWRFHQSAPTAQHRLAIAAAGPAGAGLSIRFHWVTPTSTNVWSSRRCWSRHD